MFEQRKEMANRPTSNMPVDKELKKELMRIRKHCIKEYGKDCGWRGAGILLLEKSKKAPPLPYKDGIFNLSLRGVRLRNPKLRDLK